MKLRYKLGTCTVILAVTFFYGKCSKNKPISNVLPPNTIEHISVDPTHHTITVVTQHGTTTSTLPDNTTTVDVGTNGAVTVKAKQFGYEFKPFLGWGYTGEGSVILGSDFLYLKKLDLGVAGYGGVTGNIKPALTLSYTLISNTRLTCSVNPIGSMGVFVTVRF